MLARILRILTFRADHEDFLSLDGRHLGVGLFVTWLVGIGRYWDNPRVELLQKAGVGSVVYVFLLAVLLWLLGLGLKPRRWSYVNLLTFITLTAPPGLLYAIPVERFLSSDGARTANLAFLAVVAAWRVALYGLYLRRYAALSAAPLVVQLLLPLTLIVSGLAVLNLERAVFDVMGGVEETTSADTAYAVLVLLTLLSLYLSPVLVGAYVVIAALRWRSRVAGAEPLNGSAGSLSEPAHDAQVEQDEGGKGEDGRGRAEPRGSLHS
ncbi:MAG: hypothetical protein ACOC92_01970 [bacterium]